MSFNVLVIPEDATNDHYVLRPIMSAVLKRARKTTASITILTDPSVHGVTQALNDDFIAKVIRRYPMIDLFVLCVDRDGNDGRDVSIQDRVSAASAHLRPGTRFLGTSAHQELEVWCLAGMDDLPKEWKWADVRAEPHPKEVYYLPYAERRDLLKSAGEGREILGREAASRYQKIRSRCSEVEQLEGELS